METDVKLNPAIRTVAFAALLAASGAGHALEWSDNQLSFQAGSSFSEPGVNGPIKKRVYEFTHFSGDKLGTNLVVGQILESDGADPAVGGGHGAQEFFGLIRRTLSFSRVTGKEVRFGPVKDVSLAVRFDRGPKNIDFAAAARKSMFGLALDIDVPKGFLVTNLYAYYEKNYNSFVAREVTFDTALRSHTVWSVPLSLGIPLSWDGDLTYTTQKGKDGFGNSTKPELRFHTELLTEVVKGSGLMVGVGYELYRNKYGANQAVVQGARQNTALLIARYHF